MATSALPSSSGSSSSRGVDPWDAPLSSSASSSSTTRQSARTTDPVRDDWENDDDEAEQDFPPRPSADHNKQIWEDANTHSSHPMPLVLLSPTSTSSHSSAPPPPSVFQPTMRILKRPSNSPGGSASTTPPPGAGKETLQERERKYQEARERIFGASSAAKEGDGDGDGTGRKSKSPMPSVQPAAAKVVREPKGPSEAAGSQSAKGFGERRTKPPNSTS